MQSNPDCNPSAPKITLPTRNRQKSKLTLLHTDTRIHTETHTHTHPYIHIQAPINQQNELVHSLGCHVGLRGCETNSFEDQLSSKHKIAITQQGTHSTSKAKTYRKQMCSLFVFHCSSMRTLKQRARFLDFGCDTTFRTGSHLASLLVSMRFGQCSRIMRMETEKT
jgi:hypothetical protein